MNRLGIGTILAITGITLTIAGLIILPLAENSLAQSVRKIIVIQGVSIFNSPEFFVIDALKRVNSSSSGHAVESNFLIDQEFCLDVGFLQQGELFWSMKKAKLNFDTRCGFVDVTVKATSIPEITETLGDCFSNNFFTKTVSTLVDATYSGTLDGISVSGDGQIISIKSTSHSCP